MTLSLILAKKIASLFMIILAGYLLVKLKLLKSSDSKCISVISLYLITPCVIISSFEVDITSEIQRGLLLAVGTAIISQTLLIIITALLSHVFHFVPAEKGSVIFSNTGNLIIPLVIAVLGQEWVIYSIAYFCVQLVTMWSYGKSVMCGERKPDIRKMLLNINMISVFAGVLVFFSGFRLPPLVQSAADSLGDMMGPATMLVTGMLIADMDFSIVFRNARLWLCVALRLLVYPFIILSLLKILPLADLVPNGKTILLITLLAACSPSASTITQMAQVYGNDAEYANAINIITILLCIITMPLLVSLYML